MNVCYDKKIAVLYFCIEGEPRLQTRSGRRAGRDWTAQTTVNQRHVIVLLVVFCFGFFFLPDEPLPCCKYGGSSASSLCARHCLLLCVLVSV